MNDNSNPFHKHLKTLSAIEKPDYMLAGDISDWAAKWQSQIANCQKQREAPSMEMLRGFEIYKSMRADFVKLIYYHDRLKYSINQLTDLYEVGNFKKHQ